MAQRNIKQLDTDAPSVERLAELQQLIADFAGILRMVHLADSGHRESDVEHSYGLAMTCWFLAPKLAPELDQLKIFKYALAHDIVEIHAGDTFVFGDSNHIASKPQREQAAIEQLAKDWPDFSELAEAAQAYKDKRNEEAKFVYSVDKLLPVIMINLGEKSAFWQRHKITFEMEKNLKMKTVLVSDYIAPYYDRLVDWMTHPDYFYNPRQSK
jgi:putative hydrolase of HD superfamily